MIERLERQRQRIAAAAGEIVDGAAVAQELRRPRKHRRAAAREEDVIGAAPLRERSLSLGGARQGSGRVGAEPAGEDGASGQLVGADDRRAPRA